MIVNGLVRGYRAPQSIPIFASVVAACATTLSSPVLAARAVSASGFLNSIGVNSSIAVRGENLAKTEECARYLGIRWFRSGIEGDVPIRDLIALHRSTGAKFSWSPGSGRTDLDKLLSTARQLAAAGALLAFEGPNEPNNWAITYKGEHGGGRFSWLPVAYFQRDLYRAVKADPQLKQYPVWSITEGGADSSNVGLQFLTIPPDSGCLLPPGTVFADYANVHNYIYHPNSPGVEDNKTWNAADTTAACKVDGLYGEYGLTWAGHYKGYAGKQLISLPRVTTETGCTIGGAVTPRIQALNLLTMYLDQFKRGWSYTAVYLLRDRVDEAGNQKFGFYRPNYTPRLAAVYLHNLTSILADTDGSRPNETLNYTIPDEPATVHDLLLEKRNGSLYLVVWDERVTGSDTVTVHLGRLAKRVEVYDTTIGVEPQKELSNVRSVKLSLSDHPIIIALPGGTRYSAR